MAYSSHVPFSRPEGAKAAVPGLRWTLQSTTIRSGLPVYVREAPEWCFHELGAKFAAHPTWQPEIAEASDAHYRKKQDCLSKFDFVKVVRQAALLFLNFHFVITQFNCSHASLPAPAGTSFEVWARSDSALVKCYTSSLASAPGTNVSYKARCDLPKIHSPILPPPPTRPPTASASPPCFNMSIMTRTAKAWAAATCSTTNTHLRATLWSTTKSSVRTAAAVARRPLSSCSCSSQWPLLQASQV